MKTRTFEKLAEHRDELIRRARIYSGWSAPDVEDVVQQAFVQALASPAAIESVRPEAVLAYLTAIAINLIRDAWKRRLDQVEVSAMADRLPAPDPELSSWRQVSDEQVEEAVQRLPPRVREAYQLRAQGLRYGEIAAMMGVTDGCVARWMSDARALLYQELAPVEPEPGERQAS